MRVARRCFTPVPLGNVAAKTRHMPDNFLNKEGTGLAKAGVTYFDRLIPRKYETGRPFV